MSKRKRCQAKNWVFTLNNYTEEDERRLKEMECEWMIFAHEHQEEGTPHLQGAICFKGKRDGSALGKLFKWHLEVMHGSPQDSKTYCTKEDSNYFEKGTMPESNSKKRKIEWEEIYQLASEGRFEEIRRDVYIRYMRQLKQLYFDNRHDANLEEFGDKELKEHFLWLWGPTGTGKSHTARRIAKELGCDKPYLKGLNKWWDGYNYQKVVIIEEADPKRCEHLGSFFKMWADKWSFYAEIKGNTIPDCRPEYLIVTSNYSMMDCFPVPDDYIPMKRRFTEQKLENRDFHLFWPKVIASGDPQTPTLLGPQSDAGSASIVEDGAALEPGNSIPVPTSSTGLEPGAERQKEDDDVNETGLIDPPAILENTPEDFNSEEC